MQLPDSTELNRTFNFFLWDARKIGPEETVSTGQKQAQKQEQIEGQDKSKTKKAFQKHKPWSSFNVKPMLIQVEQNSNCLWYPLSEPGTQLPLSFNDFSETRSIRKSDAFEKN